MLKFCCSRLNHESRLSLRFSCHCENINLLLSGHQRTQIVYCHLLIDFPLFCTQLIRPSLSLLFPLLLLFTCSINSSACLSSASVVIPWEAGQAWAAVQSAVRSGVPWEPMGLASPEHPPSSIMQQTRCLAGVRTQSRVLCSSPGAPAKIRYEGLCRAALATVKPIRGVEAPLLALSNLILWFRRRVNRRVFTVYPAVSLLGKRCL